MMQPELVSLNRLVNNFIREIVDDKVGGILAIPALDTVKRVDKKQQIIRTEKRDEIWLAQTPQMFRYDLLKKAIEHHLKATQQMNLRQ